MANFFFYYMSNSNREREGEREMNLPDLFKEMVDLQVHDDVFNNKALLLALHHRAFNKRGFLNYFHSKIDCNIIYKLSKKDVDPVYCVNYYCCLYHHFMISQKRLRRTPEMDMALDSFRDLFNQLFDPLRSRRFGNLYGAAKVELDVDCLQNILNCLLGEYTTLYLLPEFTGNTYKKPIAQIATAYEPPDMKMMMRFEREVERDEKRSRGEFVDLGEVEKDRLEEEEERIEEQKKEMRDPIEKEDDYQKDPFNRIRKQLKIV